MHAGRDAEIRVTFDRFVREWIHPLSTRYNEALRHLAAGELIDDETHDLLSASEQAGVTLDLMFFDLEREAYVCQYDLVKSATAHGIDQESLVSRNAENIWAQVCAIYNLTPETQLTMLVVKRAFYRLDEEILMQFAPGGAKTISKEEENERFRDCDAFNKALSDAGEELQRWWWCDWPGSFGTHINSNPAKAATGAQKCLDGVNNVARPFRSQLYRWRRTQMGALIYQPDAVTRLFPDAPPLQARIQTILKSIYALDAEMNSAFASVLRQGRQVRWSPPLPTPEQIVQEYRLIDEQRAELERKMNDLSFTPDDPHLKPEEFFRREADSIFEALLVIKVNFRTRAGVILSESGITVRNSETGLPKKIPPVPRTEQNMDDQLYAICNPPSSDQAYIREVEHNLANLRARLAPNIKGSVRPTPNRPRRTV